MTEPLRVLILEDRPSDAELMVLRLEDEGFDPEWVRVETEPEYLAELDAIPDLILSDWSLPTFSGLRALKVVRGRGLDIPFVIVSGGIGEEAAVDAVHQGADDYVLKDRLARLGPAVRRALEAKRLRDEQRRAEAALRQAAMAFESSTEGVTLTDVDGTIVAVNRAFVEITGYAEAEVLGRNSRLLQSGRQDETFYRDLWATLTISGRWRGELWNRRKDGEVYPEWLTISAVKDEQGRTTNYVGVFSDVGDSKRAHDALLESEETHRALVEGLPDIVMRFDRDGRHLFVSENVRAVADFAAAQFIGKTHRELGFPEAQCRSREEAIRGVFDSGAPFETELTLDGTRGPAIHNWRLVPERDARGMVRSVLSLSRDITAQRRAQEDYRTLFREMLNGFALHEIICDEVGLPADYRFLAVNPAFERMTGLKAEDVVGRTALDVMPDTERRWIETYGGVALTGEPAFFENYDPALNKHFEVTAFRPAPNQFACIFVDISERKALGTQLLQAQKMESVGRLAGGVAHDFNNMLGAILGHAEMALDTIDPSHPLYADLEQIRKAAERSAGLTRQLLAFARKQTIAPRVLDLNETVGGMLDMLKRLIGEDIDLAWRPGRGLGHVLVDPSQVDQILANLAVNARDAIAGIGKISIETASATLDATYCATHPGFLPGEYVLLVVSDDGCGMDRDTLALIFEPFYTTKAVGRGTGLGLATVYGIVRQNEGFINAYSEVGVGTTFRVYLPRHSGRIVPPVARSRPQAGSGGRETVLLVEDEPAILSLGTAMLERLGYNVVAAATPGQAIRLAEEHAGEIHLLMTDVVMPEMNGRDLAGNLLSRYPHLRRVFMSGYTANAIAHRGVLDEGVHFIQKPFSMQDLSAKLREALDGE